MCLSIPHKTRRSFRIAGEQIAQRPTRVSDCKRSRISWLWDLFLLCPCLVECDASRRWMCACACVCVYFSTSIQRQQQHACSRAEWQTHTQTHIQHGGRTRPHIYSLLTSTRRGGDDVCDHSFRHLLFAVSAARSRTPRTSHLVRLAAKRPGGAAEIGRDNTLVLLQHVLFRRSPVPARY